MTVISRGQMQFIELIQEKATQYGLCLEIVELDEHWFRLSYSNEDGLVWSCDLWPSIICSGILPRRFDERKGAHVIDYEPCQIKWNDPHRGPILDLPRRWTLLDVVEAMNKAKAKEEWKLCNHKWRVSDSDSDLGGDREEVVCVKCQCPGERSPCGPDGEVFFPAT